MDKFQVLQNEQGDITINIPYSLIIGVWNDYFQEDFDIIDEEGFQSEIRRMFEETIGDDNFMCDYFLERIAEDSMNVYYKE